MADILLHTMQNGLELHNQVKMAILSHADPNYILTLAAELHLPCNLPCRPTDASVSDDSLQVAASAGLLNFRYTTCVQHFILWKAVSAAHIPLIKKILAGHYDLQKLMHNPLFLPRSPFHLACYQGTKAAVDCFIPQRPKLDIRGGRPLRDWGRQLSALELLMRRDDPALMENWWPEINKRRYRLSPAHIAIETGAVKCLSHIAKNYPSWLDLRGDYNHTAFVHALKTGSTSICEVLADHTNLCQTYGEEAETVLHQLFQYSLHRENLLPLNAPTTAALLIEKGCDVNARTTSGETAISYLCTNFMDTGPTSYKRWKENALWFRSVAALRRPIPSLCELRVAAKSSLEVLLKKGADPTIYVSQYPVEELLTDQLSEMYRCADELSKEELVSTIAYVCDIFKLLLSHGTEIWPEGCGVFFWGLLAQQTSLSYSGPTEGMFSNEVIIQLQRLTQLLLDYGTCLLVEIFFVDILDGYKPIEHAECFRLKMPFYAMFLDALPHRQYYCALEKLAKTAAAMTGLINCTELGDAGEGLRDVKALERFMEERKKRTCPFYTTLFKALPRKLYSWALKKLGKTTIAVTWETNDTEQGVVDSLREDIKALELFIRDRKNHVRPLKHIARSCAPGSLGRKLAERVSEQPRTDLTRQYILSYSK